MTLTIKSGVAALVAGASLLSATPSLAGDWTGAYIGIGGGAGAIVHDLNVDISGANVNFDGIGGEGVFFTGQVGYDFQVAPQFVVGVFFDYDFSGLETDISLSAGGFSASAPIKVDNAWAIGARVGYLPTASQQTLWYLTAGYTELSMDDLTLTATGLGSASLEMPDFQGYFLGGGVETMLTKNLSLKAEYRYSEFDRESLFSVPGFDVGLEPSMHTARLNVSYKFGFDRPAAYAEPLK